MQMLRQRCGSCRAIWSRGSATQSPRLSCNGPCSTPLSGDAVVPRIGAVILLIAGLYQFASVKRACLTHCRTPIGYFLTRWRDGPLGAFRMGLDHGFVCVGCCWALMATAFAVGVMNAFWMVMLGVLAFVEQTAPYGQTLRRLLGVALLIGSIWQLAALP
jgi:predicted metal-binding membrane protein